MVTRFSSKYYKVTINNKLYLICILYEYGNVYCVKYYDNKHVFDYGMFYHSNIVRYLSKENKISRRQFYNEWLKLKTMTELICEK